jgi:hypothetical protein
MSEKAKHASPGQEPLFAIGAEFAAPEAILAAARTLRDLRLGRLDIHSPVPIDGAIAAMRAPLAPIPYVMAVGAFVVGFVAMMGMCIEATAHAYVLDIGGRPLVSWPAFVVPSTSFAALVSAAVVFFNMTFLNRLPLLNHPAFNIPNFERVTRDRYFLTVEPMSHARDLGAEDIVAIEAALARLDAKPLAVHRVPR